MTKNKKSTTSNFPHRHLLTAEALKREEILYLLDLANDFADLNRQAAKKQDTLRGRTQINLFFESSTRTQSSFELAGKRLGADVMNMSVKSSAISKGETLIDTAMTLNAMRPDILVVRHHAAGAVELLSQKVDCSVINAGDGVVGDRLGQVGQRGPCAVVHAGLASGVTACCDGRGERE